MKNLKNYLVFLVSLAIAVVCDTDSLNSTVANVPAEIYTCEVVAFYSDFSTSDTDLYLPRRSSTINLFRLRGTAKRVNNSYKNNFEFIVGKTINIDVENFVPKDSLNFYSLFIKPDEKFISLGRLII